MKNNAIRLAVVGARRGLTHIRTIAHLQNLLTLTGVCDTNPQMLKEWEGSEVKLYRHYDELLADPEVDAVCLATPVQLHARQSIAALQAGKHVLCEVTAAWTLEEGRQLIAAVEQSGLTYMMAENCCFFRGIMMVARMVELGLFGELISAEGSYLHDCSDLCFSGPQELAWRGELCHRHSCNWYPTHSLGPVCQWLGINRSDRLASLASWGNRPVALSAYSERNFGKDSRFAQPDFWRMPDTCNTLLRTERGVLIEHRLELSSPRPRPQNRYALQGTHASFVLNPDFDDTPRIWLRDQSPTSPTGLAKEWESLWKYADQWEHPLWKEFGEVAMQTGHYGADFFVLREFGRAIAERRRPAVDVYDAVTWSAVTPLSAASLAEGGKPVEIPCFH